MNAHLVPAVLLMAAIALSWPEFVAMFRLDGRVAVIEVSLMSVATAAFLGAMGLALQQFGLIVGGLLCTAGACLGHCMRRTTHATQMTLLSSGCILALLASRTFV